MPDSKSLTAQQRLAGIFDRPFVCKRQFIDVNRASCAPKKVLYPAEVCIVDWDGEVVYQSYCDPGHPKVDFKGGVPVERTQNAKRLPTVASDIRQLIEGKILVGHGLAVDLRKLSVVHPRNLKRDTYRCSFFRSGRLTLKHLVKLHLEEDIQCGSGRHSALADAQATMRLYRYVVENSPSELAQQWTWWTQNRA